MKTYTHLNNEKYDQFKTQMDDKVGFKWAWDRHNEHEHEYEYRYGYEYRYKYNPHTSHNCTPTVPIFTIR